MCLNVLDAMNEPHPGQHPCPTTSQLAITRLQKDYMKLLTEPLDNIVAHPTEDNIFQWVYVFRGPTDTPFSGGIYLGRLLFCGNYPLSGPDIYMKTPSGKFSSTKKVCVSGISAMHPEKWSSLNTVSTILLSLYSFMADEKCGHFAGHYHKLYQLTADQLRTRQAEFAAKSWSFALNDPLFQTYFPQLVDEAKNRTAK